eukprot:COSAG05_NODE_26222_length_190_cov_21.175824_1_plen_41_part_01
MRDRQLSQQLGFKLRLGKPRRNSAQGARVIGNAELILIKHS